MRARANREHKTNCDKAEPDKSAVAKHTWTDDHRRKWDDTTDFGDW